MRDRKDMLHAYKMLVKKKKSIKTELNFHIFRENNDMTFLISLFGLKIIRS